MEIQQPAAIIKKPKRMMNWTLSNGVTTFHINYSSLDLLNTCKRKAYYALEKRYRSDAGSPATQFGTAIHKAMEHWHCLPIAERQLMSADKERAELMAYGHGIDAIYDGALETIRQFVIAAQPIAQLPHTDKRSLDNGIKILMAYFKHYQDCRLTVVRDAAGLPMVERDFEFRLYTSEQLVINYFGTVDAVMRDEVTGDVLVLDHKTTHSLGKEFISRAKPNHQFTGYIMGAQKCFGLNTREFMINGIQVAKTKCEFMRIKTERDEHDMDELKQSIIYACQNYSTTSPNEDHMWPMSAPTACTMWGNCQYIDACSSPVHIRQQLLDGKFGVRKG